MLLSLGRKERDSQVIGETHYQDLHAILPFLPSKIKLPPSLPTLSFPIKIILMFPSRYSSLTPSPHPSLQRKVNHIALLNLKPQDLDICACPSCIYSRQLNRKSTLRLDLSKSSSYRQDYHCRHRARDRTASINT
jgi:hypothetical protein